MTEEQEPAQPQDETAGPERLPRAEAAGYYLWPPAWVGSPPGNARGSAPEPGAFPPPVDLAELEESVFETELPQGLRARVCRDGLFIFDFSQWAPVLAEDFGGTFEALAQPVGKRVALMNAHLACLFTALARVQHRSVDPMIVTPSDIFPMNAYEDLGQGMGIPNLLLGHALHARHAITYPPGLSPQADPRILLRYDIEIASVEESFNRLASLLEHASSERVLQLSELLVRSAASYRGHDHNLCLVTAWTVIESLLQELWRRYLEENRRRGIDGDEVSFINAERKQKLTQGRDITASLLSEILSLVDVLPFQLYNEISTARTARNKWVHDLLPVAGGTAGTALRAAEEMLRLVEDVDLEMPKSLSVQV